MAGRTGAFICGAGLLAAAVVVQAPVAVLGQSLRVEQTALERFEQAAQDYAQLHRGVAARLLPLESTNPTVLVQFFFALSAGIQSARPSARQGDMFTPVASAIIRVRIADALLAHGIDANDLRGEMSGDGAHPVMQVNGPYVSSVPSTMVGCVLEVLPALPLELQYRFVGEDLMVIDVDAALVVDILPNALPDDHLSSRPAVAGGV